MASAIHFADGSKRVGDSSVVFEIVRQKPLAWLPLAEIPKGGPKPPCDRISRGVGVGGGFTKTMSRPAHRRLAAALASAFPSSQLQPHKLVFLLECPQSVNAHSAMFIESRGQNECVYV